jgi:hypothetical protein
VAQRPGPITRCGVPTVLGNYDGGRRGGRHQLLHRLPPGALADRARGVLPPQITGEHPHVRIDHRRAADPAGRPSEAAQLGRRAARPAGDPGRARRAPGDGGHLPGRRQPRVGPADAQGYSVFYIADFETRRGYSPVLREVRDYRRGGKAAPRMVDHLNWDGEGGEEILLEVFGDGSELVRSDLRAQRPLDQDLGGGALLTGGSPPEGQFA